MTTLMAAPTALMHSAMRAALKPVRWLLVAVWLALMLSSHVLAGLSWMAVSGISAIARLAARNEAR